MGVCVYCASYIPNILNFDICKWGFTLCWRYSRRCVSLHKRVLSFELVNVFGQEHYVTGAHANPNSFQLPAVSYNNLTNGRTSTVGRRLVHYFWGKVLNLKEGKKLSKSKHNCLYFVFFIIRLTTCFGPCAGPYSGHRIYKEENCTV